MPFEKGNKLSPGKKKEKYDPETPDGLASLDHIEEPWQRLEGEPLLWYERFAKFYLTMGTVRSLRGSYRRWVAAEGRDPDKGGGPPIRWHKESKKWRWVERADLFFQHQMAESFEIMAAAQLRLQQLSLEAVNALRASLASDGPQRVTAAKEILDRAGISGVQNVRISGTIGLSGMAGIENLDDNALDIFVTELAQAALSVSHLADVKLLRDGIIDYEDGSDTNDDEADDEA